MKLFSGIFGNKKTQTTPEVPQAEVQNIAVNPPEAGEDFAPPQVVLDLAQELLGYAQTAHLGMELDYMAKSPDTQKFDYFRALNILKSIADEEAKKVDTHRLMLEIANNIKLIKNSGFSASFHGFEDFSEDFPTLILEFEVLLNIHNEMPGHADPQFPELYQKYAELSEVFRSATQQSVQLKKEQLELSDEIIKFTNTVNEFSQKYRLSIDWDGKRPLMASLGNKLSKKREELSKTEGALNREIKILYENYPTMQNEFLMGCDYYINILEEKINLFDEDSVHTVAFEQMANKFEDIIKTQL